MCASERDQGKQSVWFPIEDSEETCKKSIPLYVGKAGLCSGCGCEPPSAETRCDAVYDRSKKHALMSPNETVN